MRYRIAFDANVRGIEQSRASLSRLHGAARVAAGALAAVLGRSMARAAAAGILWNARMESARTRLAQVTRSFAQASERLREMERIEATSPYDATELAEASRQLQVMSAGALAGSHGMRIVADVAAGTNASVSQVADAVGRLWMALRLGRDAGRGLMTLEQMGAVSADLRMRLNAMASAGEDFGRMWAEVEAELSRFRGAAEAAANTVSGQMQTLRRSFEQALGVGTRALFGDMRTMLGHLNAAVSDNGVTPALRQIGAMVRLAVKPFADLAAMIARSRTAMQAMGVAATAIVQVRIAQWIAEVTTRIGAKAAALFASKTALDQETAALRANSAAHSANAAARDAGAAAAAAFTAAPRTAAALGMLALGRGVLTGRSTSDMAGQMTSVRYTTEMVAARLEQAGSQAGLTLGQRAAERLKAELAKGASVKGVLGAVGLGLGLGFMAKGMIDAQTARLEAENIAWEDITGQFEARNKAIAEQLTNLGAVAEKAELIRKIEEEIARLQREREKSRYSDLERGAMDAQMSALRTLQMRAERVDDAALARREAARRAAEIRKANEEAVDPALARIEKRMTKARFEAALANAPDAAARAQLLSVQLERVERQIEQIGDLRARMEDPTAAADAAELERLIDEREALAARLSAERADAANTARAADAWRERFAAETAIIRLRAEGNTAEADAAERALRIRELAAEIMRSAGIEDEARAARIAEMRIAAEDAEAKRRTAIADSRPMPVTPSDRLARVGGFVGGIATDLARRQLNAAERTVKLLERIAQRNPTTMSPMATFA